MWIIRLALSRLPTNTSSRRPRLTLSLALNRYHSGAASYLEVIISQAAALDAESASIDLQCRQLVTSVALLRALGGGWD